MDRVLALLGNGNEHDSILGRQNRFDTGLFLLQEHVSRLEKLRDNTNLRVWQMLANLGVGLGIGLLLHLLIKG